MMESHYKIEAFSALPTHLATAIWELADRGETSVLKRISKPTCFYGIIDDQYQFSYCQAALKEHWDYLSAHSKNMIWILTCYQDLKKALRPEPPTQWQQNIQISVPDSDEIVILKSDSPQVSETLLIEKKFLTPVTPNFRPNKYNIPIKACRKKIMDAPFLPNVKVGWCEVHHDNIFSNKNGCSLQIPRDYLPCDIDNDQAGSYCSTHSGGSTDFESHCKRYKGPLIDSLDDLEEKEIPQSYLTCEFWRSEDCSIHDGKKINDKYCDKYDGPYLYADLS